MIGPSQSTSDHLDEGAIPLKSKLAGFRLERRLVRDKGQLVLHEGAQRLGNEVELLGKLLVRSAQPVEPDTKSFIQFRRATPLKPCAESVGEDRSLRRAWLGRERFQLIRQIVRQIELVPCLEGSHDPILSSTTG
jgi:hypothetical protein